VLFSLAAALRDMVAQKGAIRLVPLPVSAARLGELMVDETMSKKPPRELIVKAFEVDNPGYAEMIKQAMEMRALVVIARVNEPAEAAPFLEPAMLEELSIGCGRLIVSCCSLADTPVRLPREFTERSICKQLCAVSLVLARAKIGDKDCKTIFKRLRMTPPGVWPLVRGVHLSFSEVGREGLAELQELLGSRSCALRTLDLSLTQVDAFPVIQFLKTNTSVTALDLRRAPKLSHLYQGMADTLFGADAKSQLAYLRCDAFEVLEDEKALSLRETPLSEVSAPGALSLLLGLLRQNTSLLELDLSATDLDKGAATALAALLGKNHTLTTLKLEHNPELDDEARALLRKAVDARRAPLNLVL